MALFAEYVGSPRRWSGWLNVARQWRAYSTITAASVIFLYVSYALPTMMGLLAYDRWWTVHGPWRLGDCNREPVIAGAPHGFYPVDVGEPATIHLVQFALNAISRAGLMEHNRREPGPCNHEREPLDGLVRPEADRSR